MITSGHISSGAVTLTKLLAIHFYTQWFERLGADPLTVLLAGILALGFAIGLWYFNRALFDSGRHRPLAATSGLSTSATYQTWLPCASSLTEMAGYAS